MDNDQDVSLKIVYGSLTHSTDLLSYLNCCAVCRNVIKPRNSSRQQEYSLSPGAAEVPTSATTPAGRLAPHHNADKREERRHCDTNLCRFGHNRWVLAVLALREIVHLVITSILFSAGLAGHNWSLLRSSGLLAVQWWQVFLLPRRWHAGKSIVVGQLVSCAYLVRYSSEGRSNWSWWEPPFVIEGVLLKIAYPQ
ncbi:hypothetical protein F4809DRAFT_662186 [Biscogniauxia mediterranea]|nr:hypothetical protein F4809DRAFT_662186 [Biscogniauxia mediterranea]